MYLPRKRNVVVTILLTIFTCGIYYLFSIYQTSKDLNDVNGSYMNNPAIDLLLSIVTCGIYTIYWYYKIGRQIETIQYDLGLRSNSISILTMILSIFGFGIISIAIVQSEINRLIDEISIHY